MARRNLSLRTVLEVYVPDSDRALEYLEEKRPALLDLPVVWNGRLKRTAGMARFTRRTPVHPWEPEQIDLAPQLLKKKDDLRRVVLHETGHFVAGRSADHGPSWEVACRILGLHNPTRADYLQSMADERKLVAYCPECERGTWGFRYKKRQLKYFCRRCEQTVVTDPAVLKQINPENAR